MVGRGRLRYNYGKSLHQTLRLCQAWGKADHTFLGYKYRTPWQPPAFTAMSWQCFVDNKTGMGYKSKGAAAKSTIHSETYEFALDKSKLCQATRAAWSVQQNDAASQTVCLVPCEGHKLDSQPVVNTSTETSDPTALVLLVCFDGEMLPPAPKLYSAADECWQDYLDGYRQREADALSLEKVRQSMSAKLGRDVLFVYAYGDDAMRRATAALPDCRVTPRFDSVTSALCYLNKF